MIKAIDEVKKIKTIAVILQDSPLVRLNLEESGIYSPQHLKNKRLGTQDDTDEAKIFYSVLLGSYDIDSKTIEFVITGKNPIDELKNKKVDTLSIYRTNEIYEIKNGVRL